MSTADSFYIVALREPGSSEKPKGYVICKAIATLERNVRPAGEAGSAASPAGGAPQQTIVTFLDEQFASGVRPGKYEAIGWDEGVPIPDGTESDALFLGTADNE